MSQPKTRTIRVNCTWSSEHEVEVPVDWEEGQGLSELLAGMQQVEPGADLTAATAELTDWEVVW
jgi:hypothetical protein